MEYLTCKYHINENIKPSPTPNLILELYRTEAFPFYKVLARLGL